MKAQNPPVLEVIANNHRLQYIGTREYSNGFSPSLESGWRVNADGVQVFTCDYAIAPLYYSVNDKTFAISTSPFELARRGYSSGFNWTSISLLLYLGWLVGDETPFSGIYRLPALEYNWFWPQHKEPPKKQLSLSGTNQSYKSVINEYSYLFRNAISQSTDHTCTSIVPLSGGRDSRHIFLELIEQGVSPKYCVTTAKFPPSGNDDITIARQLANKYGIEHVTLNQNFTRFNAEVKKNNATNFEVPYEHAWIIGLCQHLSMESAQIYDGIAGDVLSAGLRQDEKKLRLVEGGNLKDLAKMILGTRPDFLDFLTPEIEAKINTEEALCKITEELERVMNTPNPVAQFYFWNRTRRSIALVTSLFNTQNNVIMPFLNPELFYFLSSIPASYTICRTLHDDVLRAAYPYETTRFEDTSKQTKLGYHHRRLYFDILTRLNTRKSSWLRQGALSTRLIRYMVDQPDKGRWLAPQALIYLRQLERIEKELTFTPLR